MNLTDLIARWNTDEGRPYKGSLIDMDAYRSTPNNIGCMCAQGQVLHLVAGWTPERINDVDQVEADRETAKLLNISRAHAVLIRVVNDKADGAPAVVLTDPGKVLGGKWSMLLDFWWHLDGMTAEQWDAAWDAASDPASAAAGYSARDAAGDAAGYAARDAAGGAARDAARAAARDAAGDAAWAAGEATSEIQGSEILMERHRPLFFLPSFGFASPADIPARPADYGAA